MLFKKIKLFIVSILSRIFQSAEISASLNQSINDNDIGTGEDIDNQILEPRVKSDEDQTSREQLVFLPDTNSDQLLIQESSSSEIIELAPIISEASMTEPEKQKPNMTSPSKVKVENQLNDLFADLKIQVTDNTDDIEIKQFELPIVSSQ